ncbi:MAG: single-stranded DNA-binding protein [Mariprofundaceae bacterium]|nr:single-stranded DNA-binding protein [Mariprofundaceae bacterium]
MNVYAFTGRLGKDAETRFTQSGAAICSFSVAVDYGYGDNKGTNWLRCSLFGKRAEGNLPQYLTKGTQVGISGELRVREYDDRDGARRTSVEVNVNTLDLLGSKQDSQQPSSPHGKNGQQDGFPTQGAPQQQPAQRNTQSPNGPHDPFAQAPDFGDVPVDDDLPF